MSPLPPPTLPDSLANWQADSRLANIAYEWLSPSDIPQPDRSLLVHDRDMTSTLAKFHSENIALQILHSQNLPHLHLREVILRTESSQKPVEYGLIEVHLDSLPENLQQDILDGQRPLGGLLNEAKLAYQSSPLGYFRVQRHEIGDLFPPSRGKFLYGRYNQLSGEKGQCLARIIEILPDFST